MASIEAGRIEAGRLEPLARESVTNHATAGSAAAVGLLYAPFIALLVNFRMALVLLSQWLLYDLGCAEAPRGKSVDLLRNYVETVRRAESCL